MPDPAPTEYATYLLVDDLLTLQRPLTDGAHDEMLFIVVHQVYELWFRLLLHELDRLRRALAAADLALAAPTLERILRVDELLIDQLGILETMTPGGFLEFRDPLAPASGFQSAQFRSIEALCGGAADAEVDGGPTLWGAFCAAGRRLGLDLPDGGGEPERRRRLEALVELLAPRRPATALRALAERLLDHDEAIARWRHRHALMAAREIGSRRGTGGSLGVAYLRSTLDQRFFPELWEVRAEL